MGGIQSNLQISETQSEEISVISSDICEVPNELRSDQKETNLRQLTCANEKVGTVDDEMAPKKLEDIKLCHRYQENDGTKPLVLASERKCSHVERKTHMSNVVKTIPEDEYRKMQDPLKSGLVRKETILRQLTCANEKVNAADDEMAPKKLEDGKLCRRDQENDGTKPLVLASERKSSQVERKTHMSNVVKTIPEDEYTKVQDQLKSKKDQFNDLVEAHEKLRSEFRLSESQCNMERLQLNQKIPHLERSLRIQSVSYDLRVIKLGICKLSLTIKLDKEKLYEDMFEKCREQQSKIVQKDNELADLRYVLAATDILFEGMQLKNHELRRQKEDIVKELQKERAASLQSLSKLKKRLFNLQIEHGSCSTKLELKETEWRCQFERLKAGAGYSDAYLKLLFENKNMLGESKRKQIVSEECVMTIEEVSECLMAEITHERNSIDDVGLQSRKNDDEVPKSSFEEAQEIHKHTKALLDGQLEIEQASEF